MKGVSALRLQIAGMVKEDRSASGGAKNTREGMQGKAVLTHLKVVARRALLFGRILQ
jgi:hypothetical protein